MGSGASPAPFKVARRCLELLIGPADVVSLEGPPVSSGGPQGGLRIGLQDALWILVGCSYREARGAPPPWLLPLYNQIWGGQYASEGLKREELSGFFGVLREVPALGASLHGPRCSRTLARSEGRSCTLLSISQLEQLAEVLEGALPVKGPPEALLSSQLHHQQQQKQQPPASAATRGSATQFIGAPCLEGRFDQWNVQVEVLLPDESSGGPAHAPFDYLEEDGSCKRPVKVDMPAAGALAAIEALAWSMSRLEQQQREQQDQHSLLKSNRRALCLLTLLCSRVSGSVEGSLLSLPALLQGAHALADAAEHLMESLQKGSRDRLLTTADTRSALLALLGSQAQLLEACAYEMRRRPPPNQHLEASLGAVCCIISRSLGVLKALRQSLTSLEVEGPPPLEKEAVAASAAAAVNCLRCCYELMKAVEAPVGVFKGFFRDWLPQRHGLHCLSVVGLLLRAWHLSQEGVPHKVALGVQTQLLSTLGALLQCKLPSRLSSNRK